MGIFYNDCMSRNFAKPVFDPLNYFSSVNYFVLIIIPSVKILSFLFISLFCFTWLCVDYFECV